MRYRLRVALEVAEAMAYASSRFHNRFIHRDIKSSNVFLDDAGHAKLADFGIARLIPFPKKKQSAAAAATADATTNTLFGERDDYQVGCLPACLPAWLPAFFCWPKSARSRCCSLDRT